MIEWAPRVLARGLGFPEGPTHLGNGRVAFTEIRGQCISLFDDDGYRVIAKTGGGANGATLGSDGAIYVANNGGINVGPGGYWHAPDPIDGNIQRVTLDGGCADVIPQLPGEPPHRPNDLCFGPDGSLYFTDPYNWEDLAHLKPGRLWRADVASGDVELLGDVEKFPSRSSIPQGI
ncbi:MAG: SMP-30/gluconolactonase/LRE family protein [Actinobacteria bacterium]|nr:SMP-30/gluconolactonase/LRE family protein [Actinomycetota bacterium]